MGFSHKKIVGKRWPWLFQSLSSYFGIKMCFSFYPKNAH